MYRRAPCRPTKLARRRDEYTNTEEGCMAFIPNAAARFFNAIRRDLPQVTWSDAICLARSLASS
jgi:hypothetical protein